MDQLSPFEQAWKERFERFAAFKSDAAIAGWSETGLLTRIHYFLHFWQQPIGKKWLDIGCGAGTYSQILQQSNLDVIGVDYSIPTLLKAKAKYPGTINWGAANIYRLPFKSNCFDGIICFGVLQALSNEKTAMQEIYRVLQPNGEAWVDGLNAWCIIHWRKLFIAKLMKRHTHLNYLSPFKVSNRFKDKQIYWIPILPAKLHWLQHQLRRPSCLWIWQKAGLITRFFSHSFLIRIRS